MKGNEAVVFGALFGGATHYFGYPITPASEIAHTAALYYPLLGREFLQAECEVASINMLYGAASAGARVMTGTSGPGLSLMGEGLSYIASAELPCVVVDVQRTGPGLGSIWPEQSDYNCTVKGGGHGNYNSIVMAPNSAQEMCDFAYRAFDLAEKYRMPLIILSDAYIGQMMEPVSIPRKMKVNPKKDWAVYADAESRKNLISSIFMNPIEMSKHNDKLQKKLEDLEKYDVEFEEFKTDDAEYLFVAYGICSRICRSSIQMLRKKGVKAGMLRPKTLLPFPTRRIAELGKKARKTIVVELSNGQMFADVRLSLIGQEKPLLFNWVGGLVPSPEEIMERLEKEIK